MNPYKGLPPSSFWKTGVTSSFPDFTGIYKKKFPISLDTSIVTAGSCFAQHIARNLKARGYTVLDYEPAPGGMNKQDRTRFGFDMYSARYGNIYTTKQLLQIGREAFGEIDPILPKWTKGEKYFDPLRPGVEPNGLESYEDVILHRNRHLQRVRELFVDMDLFVFTFGLTEYWYDKFENLVLPIAPGVIAGEFENDRYEFRNTSFIEVLNDFNEFQKLLLKHRNNRRYRCLVTVSPVPLTATFRDQHVLVSTTESKAILRAVAGQLAENQPHIDYFPSYEIVTNPAAHSMHFLPNLRSVAPDAVERVMNVFFSEHSITRPDIPDFQQEQKHDMFVQCEEEMISRFGNA